MGLSGVAQAADLTGTGHIDLTGPVSPPATQVFSNVNPRFIWNPNVSNFIFVGRPYPLALGDTSNSNLIFPATPGYDSVAIGAWTFARNGSVAVGGSAQGEDAVSIGNTSRAFHHAGTAIGFQAKAGHLGVAVGFNASAGGEGAIAIGGAAAYDYESPAPAAHAARSVAIGSFSGVSSPGAIAIGWGSGASWDDAVGIKGVASGAGSVALGALSSATGTGTVAIGYGTQVFANGAFGLGNGLSVGAQGGVGLGRYNRNEGRGAAAISPTQPASTDPLFTVGSGTSDAARANAFTVYRDGGARFEGAVQLKAGSGYLTLQPGGSTSRTLTLPDMDGTMLTNGSSLDAAKLTTGTVVEARLPGTVTKLGASIELNTAEVTGNLPWSRVGDKPTTLAAMSFPDAVVVERETISGVSVISTPLRIKPQGDIPMFGSVP